jgi:hypothetical protein
VTRVLGVALLLAVAFIRLARVVLDWMVWVSEGVNVAAVRLSGGCLPGVVSIERVVFSMLGFRWLEAGVDGWCASNGMFTTGMTLSCLDRCLPCRGCGQVAFWRISAMQPQLSAAAGGDWMALAVG